MRKQKREISHVKALEKEVVCLFYGLRNGARRLIAVFLRFFAAT